MIVSTNHHHDHVAPIALQIRKAAVSIISYSPFFISSSAAEMPADRACS